MLTTREINIVSLFKKLETGKGAVNWHTLAARAGQERWPFSRFMDELLGQSRETIQNNLQRYIAQAGFPAVYTVDRFDFGRVQHLEPETIEPYLHPRFPTAGVNLVLCGEKGCGKTHLAVGIAREAIRNGFMARYSTFASLPRDVLSARSRDEVVHALKIYTQVPVLVLDDVGERVVGRNAGRIINQVIQERHRRNLPVIAATSRRLEDWGSLVEDEEMGRRIAQTLMAHGHLLSLGGVCPPSAVQLLKKGEIMEKLRSAADGLAPEPVAGDKAPGPRGNPGRVRVLVAQEDPVARDIVEHYMAALDWDVVFTSSGTEAESLLAKQHFHVAVLDVNLPHRSGFALLQQIRRDGRLKHLTRVMLLTAHNREETELKALQKGADDFIAIPFSPQVLVARIRRLLAV